MTNSHWDQEELLDQFREWLDQTTGEIHDLNGSAPVDADPELPTVGWLQLVEAFTALRQELKLQTKGTRNLEASVEQALSGLNSASRTFQSVQAKEQEAAERTSLPLVETLISLDESLLRAVKAFQATQSRIIVSAQTRLSDQLDQEFQQQSWWTKLLARGWHQQARELATQTFIQSEQEDFNGLMQGLQLIQSRLTGSLEQHQIQRLDKPGGPVDPTRMTVVELVTDSTAPPETVVEIVRPGYLWGKRVMRFAEVRAVVSRPQ